MEASMSRINIEEIQPDAYQAMFGLEGYISKSTIDSNIQEFVRLRTSLINGCNYCIKIHTDSATKLGESNERVSNLSDWEKSDLYTYKERAALSAADEITNISHSGLTSDTYSQLQKYFTDEEIAQLIMLCAVINAWNRIGISMSGSLNQYENI